MTSSSWTWKERTADSEKTRFLSPLLSALILTLPKVFDQKLTLFALVLADALIININQNQLGLEEGSGFKLLRNIFELNAQYFGSESPKKKPLIFAVRDVFLYHSFQELSEQIKEKLVHDWNKAKKPEQYSRTTIEDWFNLYIFPIPHYMYTNSESPSFREAVTKLRQQYEGCIFIIRTS